MPLMSLKYQAYEGSHCMYVCMSGCQQRVREEITEQQQFIFCGQSFNIVT